LKEFSEERKFRVEAVEFWCAFLSRVTRRVTLE